MFNNFNRPKRGASIHGCVDPGGIMQMMPFTQKAGHVGSGPKGTLNTTHLGFELCEPSGCKYNGNGSAIVAYAPPKGFFEAVRDNAIALCGYLCQEYGIDPKSGIVSHYEAHAMGCGDNHADIRHWWEVWENYTMDMFRQDVADYIENGGFEMAEPTYGTMADVPDWGKQTVQKLVDKGYLQGDGSGLGLNDTMLRILVINDRAGIFD
jgi:hypothetical protein